MNERVDPLELEIQSLRQRLHEAEELCDAISRGQVDAFVVGPTEDSKRVLMLSGAYARYRQLVEDMQQGAVTLSRSGEVLFANHSFAALLKLSPLDLLRVPLQRHVSPADRQKVAALLNPRAGQPDITARMIRADGSERPVNVSVVSANDDFTTLLVTEVAGNEEEAAATVEAIRKGEIDAVVVNDEKVVMLDSAQRFYQAAVDRMQQGVVIVSADGEITYANQRMAALAGTKRERLAGTSLYKLVTNGDQASLKSLLQAREGASAQAELRLRRTDGELVTALVTVTAIADGQRMCLVSDLRLQKRHQAADESARKFLATMAHEFRNILSPIHNSVEALKCMEKLEPEARKAVEIIERHTTRLVALIDDLRTINPRE
jgi:PAS domain S-box-containing protein